MHPARQSALPLIAAELLKIRKVKFVPQEQTWSCGVVSGSFAVQTFAGHPLRQTNVGLVPSQPNGGHRPDGGLRRWIHPLGWALVELATSRSCGRTASASSAEASDAPTVMAPPCWLCCLPRSI